ncbi:MAG: hypothetical protein IH628_08150 [Proteobacteria bacterium]|nr:hypothetical protein [Pseudomonadota bacterium]
METRRCIRGFLFMALFLSVLACTGMFANYGRFNPSDEVYQAFATYQVNKDFRYYITGPDLNPNALLGLHKSYRLDPRSLWREVQMTPEKMKEIVEGMNTKASNQREYHKGFELLDSTGRPVGVWYSLLRAQTFVRNQEDGTIRIDTPDLDIYEKKAGSLMMDTER